MGLVMFKRVNVFVLAAFLFFGFTQAGCSESSGDQNSDLASLNKTDNAQQVYDIKSVTQSKGEMPHDFTFEFNGKETSFHELIKDKVVFLNFWGTWCPPCRAEIPAIIEMNKDLSNDDFIVIGIALERRPNAKNFVKQFAEKNNINYINFVATNELKQAYSSDIQFVPTTMIIDKDMKIREKHTGGANAEQFKKMVNKYL